jgi:hypothetical protein
MISAATVKNLVQRYVPYLTFAPTERFFPSDTDAWITNSIAESWTAHGSHFSGTAVMNAPDTDTFPAGYPTGAGAVMKGSQFPAGQRLRPSDLQELNGPAKTALEGGKDVFLNFGGWATEAGGTAAPDFTQGNPDRVYAHFSKFANFISAGNPVTPDLLQNPDNTIPMVPQGLAPVMYVEIDWAGRFTRLSDKVENDFGPSNPLRDLLDRLIVFTYYFFYPLTDMPPGQPTAPGPSVVQREGQWEAVSLFIRIDPNTSSVKPGPTTLEGIEIDIPEFGDPGTTTVAPLLFLSGSFTGRSDDASPLANVRLASDPAVTWPQRPVTNTGGGFGTGTIGQVGPVEPWRPSIYVTSGTHKNMFGPTDTATDVDLGPDPNLQEGSGILGLFSGATGLIGPLQLIAGIIAIILYVLSQENHAHGTTYSPTGPDNDFVPPGGSTTVPGWTTTLSSGGMNVDPVLHTFSMLPPATGDEKDALYALPPWWNFPGRWGLRVQPSSAVRWDNGTHFRDLHGRSRSYWNTLALYRWLNLPENMGATSLLTP